MSETFGDLAQSIKQAYQGELSQSPGLAQRSINTDLYGPAHAALGRLSGGCRSRQLFVLHGLCTTGYQIYRADQPDLNLPGGPAAPARITQGVGLRL